MTMDDYLDHLLSSASWSDVNAKEGSYWVCSGSGQVDGPLSNSIGLDENEKDSLPMSMINSNQSLESLAAQDTSTVLLGGESDHGLDQEFLSTQLPKDGQECNEHTLSKGLVNGGLESGTMGVQSNMVIPIPGSVNLDSRNQLPLADDVAVSSLSFLESGHNGCSGDEPSEFHRPLGDLQTLSSIPQLWPLPSYDGISTLPPVMGEDRIHGFDLQGKHVNNDADLMRNRYVGIDNILQYDNLSTSVTRKGNQDLHHNFFSNFAAGPQISMTSSGLNSLPQTAQTTISGGCNGTAKPRPRARRGQATDPHSIAERLRREKIAERMKNLQELVPNSNKTDKASMLDEIIDYVKFLQLQVKVLSMSRLGAAGAVVPLITDSQAEGSNGLSLSPSAGQVVDNSQSPDQVALEQEIVKLMESSVTMAMQYLQSKGLCLMPIALAAAISSGGKTTPSSPVSEERIKFGSPDNLVQSSNSSSSLPGGTLTHQISSDDNNNSSIAKLGRGGITANGCNRAVKQEEVKSTAHTASGREIKPKI